ncbi:MAG: hypothetical protein ACK54K_15180 [Gemmatimonadaceae bacterium]
MFFGKLTSEPRYSSERSSSNGAAGSPVLLAHHAMSPVASPATASASAEDSLGLVLDALGGVLMALSR